MTSETISRLTCLRCDYRWFPRKEGLPVRCPHCKSPYWNARRLERQARPASLEAKIRAMEEGRDYYYAHEEEIVAAYRGKHVAVTKDGVLDADDNVETLMDRIFKDGSFSLFIHQAGEPQPVYRIGPRFLRVRG